MRRMAPIAAGLVALVAVTAATAGVRALITGAQIKDGTISTRGLRNGTIERVDLAPSTLSSLRGPRGARGAVGPAGPPGSAGPPGAATPLEYTAAYSAPAVVAPGQTGFAVALCPAETLAFSPGHVVDDVGTGRLAVVESFPISSADRRSGWQVTMLNVGSTSAAFTARAYCLRNARFVAP